MSDNDTVIVTICMPYYERYEALKQTLLSFRSHQYEHERIGISIVDDGSVNEPISFVGNYLPKSAIISMLPQKSIWSCPAVPLNKAVRQTSSPFILLQSPETYHIDPIVPRMLSYIFAKKDVVLACVKEDIRTEKRIKTGWLAHPIHRASKLWWCQLMTREFFEDIGGFDETFQDASDGEDDDFARRLDAAGAKWIWFPEEEGIACHYHIRGNAQKGYTRSSHEILSKKYKNWKPGGIF